MAPPPHFPALQTPIHAQSLGMACAQDPPKRPSRNPLQPVVVESETLPSMSLSRRAVRAPLLAAGLALAFATCTNDGGPTSPGAPRHDAATPPTPLSAS